MAKLKRGISFLLVLVFVVSLLPVSALADDLNGTQSVDSAQLMEIVKEYAAEMESPEQQATTMDSSSTTIIDFVNGIKDNLTGADVLNTLNEEPAEEPAEEPEKPAETEGNDASDALHGLADLIGGYNVEDFTKIFDSIKGGDSLDPDQVKDVTGQIIDSGFGLGDIFGGIIGSDEPTTLEKFLEALKIAGDPGSAGAFDSFADALKAVGEKNNEALVESMERLFGENATKDLIGLIGLENNDILNAIKDAFTGGIPDSSEGVADAITKALSGFGLNGIDGLGGSITGIIDNIKGAFGGTETLAVADATQATLMANGMSETDAVAATSSSGFLTTVGTLLKNFPVTTVASIVTGALAKAGVDEFDELDEIWDEILDEFDMDDIDLDILAGLIGGGADVSIEDLIALIKGSGTGSADIDWDAIFGNLNLGGDLLAKFKAWVEANGGNVDIDWILKWFENNTDIDLDVILKLIIAKIGGGESSFDIEAIIKLITGGTGTKIEIEKILELFKSLGGSVDISVIIKFLASFGGSIDISGLESILKLFIELSKSFDISAIIEIFKGFQLDFPDISVILKFLLELGGNIDLGGFDFKGFIELLINLKNSMNLPSISAVIEWLMSLKGSLGIDWSALLKLIFSKLTEFGGNFIKLIQWLLSLLDPKDPADPGKKPTTDPSTDPILDPKTPLKPYDPNNNTILDPQTPMSPITGDSTDYISLALMAVLALISMIGMAVLAKPAAVTAGETEETMGSDTFETTRDSLLSIRNERTQKRPKQ